MEFTNQQTHLQDLEIAHEAKTPEQVNVFVNGKLITLNSLDPIYAVERILNIHNMRFVSNGKVLSSALSFKFNGVKDGDTIIAIPPKKDESNFLRTVSFQRNKYNESKKFAAGKIKERFEKNWAEKYRDPDSIFEQLRDTTDPRTANESARITDLFKMKIENNHYAFRKVCSKFSLNDDFAHNDAPLNTVIPTKSITPSTELLPKLSLS